MQSFDPERFLAVRDAVCRAEREQKGIGTLGEKTLHAVLKTYYEPLAGFHEQKLGRYVADILNEEGVTEIQTRHLSVMKPKLEAFLAVTHVTVVHPVVRTKWLSWVDPETGETTKKRKSPKTGTVYDAFWELGGIPELLARENLSICLVMLDMEETRLLNGWSRDKKRGSTRADRVPAALVSETWLRSADDYRALLPAGLPGTFTQTELARAAGQPADHGYSLMRVFTAAGVTEECGKRGRSKLYRIRTPEEKERS